MTFWQVQISFKVIYLLPEAGHLKVIEFFKAMLVNKI